MSKPGIRVSLIATLFNESRQMARWLDGLDQQTRLPDEICIVDGGSTDGTYESLLAWRPAVPLRVIQDVGAGIARGRNCAIRHSTGDLIVVTDAGTYAHPVWLATLVEAIVSSGADVAGGFFEPIIGRGWDSALAATTLPDVWEIDSERFLPSSRSFAFRRSWFDAGIRYPEWLDYCEDVVFDLALRRAGARFVFVPDAIVDFQLRPDPRSYFEQYFRYARGDGKSGLFAFRHVIRYLAYAGLLAAMYRRRVLEVLLVAVLGAIYVRRPCVRLVLRRGGIEALPEILPEMLWIPALRLVGDVAKMAGYPAGLYWRVRTFGRRSPRFTWRRIDPEGRPRL